MREAATEVKEVSYSKGRKPRVTDLLGVVLEVVECYAEPAAKQHGCDACGQLQELQPMYASKSISSVVAAHFQTRCMEEGQDVRYAQITVGMCTCCLLYSTTIGTTRPAARTMMIGKEDWMPRFRLRIPYKIEEETGSQLNTCTHSHCMLLQGKSTRLMKRSVTP